MTIACCQNVLAQYTFQGTVEYERKVNLHRLYEDNEWFANMKDNVPRFKDAYFNLYFHDGETLYRPGREVDAPKGNSWFNGTPAPENVVKTDFKSGTVAAYKPIFEEKFLIEDSLRKMDWRITNEIRTIANYKCRKAVGKICDSVYVVAFYTDDIPVSGGPESFSGLPGLILELAIPRLYTTWIATKVDVIPPAAEAFAFKAKGKKTDPKKLFTDLQETFKDWRQEKERYLWWCYL
jgi:GLPGLI family protein